MKPLEVFQKQLHQPVVVEVKGGRSYRGTLDGYDQHMNLVLLDSVELLEGGKTAACGTTILRGDSVLFISS